MVDCTSEPLGRFCGMGGIFRNGICWWVAVGLVVEKGDFDCCVCRDLRRETWVDCGYVVRVETLKASRVGSHALHGVGVSGLVAQGVLDSFIGVGRSVVVCVAQYMVDGLDVGYDRNFRDV